MITSRDAFTCRQYQLPHVIEQGGGAPAVLTILYLEICARIGLSMKATLLEEGRYAVLWPEHEPLQIAGEEVVIDVFSEGALFLLSEVLAFLLGVSLAFVEFPPMKHADLPMHYHESQQWQAWRSFIRNM